MVSAFYMHFFLGCVQVVWSVSPLNLHQDLTNWNDLCPERTCFTVDLWNQQKYTSNGVINDGGFHSTVYCIKTVDPLSVPGLRHLWYRYHISLSPTSDKATTLVFGNSTKDVKINMKETENTWTQSKRVVGTKFGSSPYDVQCAGVKRLPDKVSGSHGNTFSVSFERRLQLFFPVALGLGFLLFYLAPYITKNVQFYYTSGVFLGIVASVLVVLYIFSRFVPKKNILGLGVLFGGYTFTGFLLHWIWNQGVSFVQENFFYVVCYVVISGMISFAILYRMGPAHKRTMTLVKWFLQLIALGFMFLSMQFHLFGVAIVVLFITWNNMPAFLRNFLWNIFLTLTCLKVVKKIFRTKQRRRMMTIEEFEKQGVTETEKALDELRAYCWKMGDKGRKKIYKKLMSPDKFQSFLRGESDVPDKQRKVYDHQFTDDDSESDDEGSGHNQTSSRNVSFNNSEISSPDPTPPPAHPPYPVHEPHNYPTPRPYHPTPPTHSSRYNNQYNTTFN